MSRVWRFESHINKTLLLIVLIGFFVLFSSFASINDSTQFQLELKIQHDFDVSLSIEQYDADSPLGGDANSKTRTVLPVDSITSEKICKIVYTSNIYGLNKIYLRAYPLYQLDGNNNPVANQIPVGYHLDFELIGGDWSYSLDIDSNPAGAEIVIPIVLDFVLNQNTGVVGTLESTIGVTGIFTEFEQMAGSYNSTIQIGLEAL